MEEAKSSFESQMRHALPVASRASGAGRRHFGSPGDFVPLWDKSSCSVQGHLSCYSVPFENDVRYKAFRSEYRHGKASAYGVNVYQKLVVVKDGKSGKTCSYVLTLIPERSYDAEYGSQVPVRFVNGSDNGGYSGIAFYSIPGLDIILRVNRYVSGRKVDGVYLVGNRSGMLAKTNHAYRLLKDIRLKAVQSSSSRSFGELDWWNDGDDGFGHGSDGSTFDPDDFNVGDGTFKEDANGDIFYIDENGQVFEMVDTDGDGKLDSPILDSDYAGSFGNDDNDSSSSDTDNWPTDPDGSRDDTDDNGDEGGAAGDDEITTSGSSGKNDKGNKGNTDATHPERLPAVRIPYNKAAYPGYVDGKRDCMAVARSVLHTILGQHANIGSSDKFNQLWQEKGGKMTLVGNSKAIFDIVNSHLGDGRPILAGVDYHPGSPKGNNDGTTDHWIVIVGRDYDEVRSQYYFTYIETGRYQAMADAAVSDNNRLYYDEEENTFSGPKWDKGTYTLTQVRPNK